MRFVIGLRFIPGILAIPLLAYGPGVATDAQVRAQGVGGRVNYVAPGMNNIVFDTEQFGAQYSFQEIAIAPADGGTATCITCGHHAQLFGAGYTETNSTVGMPVLNDTGTIMAMQVLDPVLVSSFNCNTTQDNAGAGFCMNIWMCQFDGVSTLSNCNNITNFPHSAAGGQQGSLHPRFSNNMTKQLFAWAQRDSNANVGYCVTNAISCEEGLWSIHILSGHYSSGAWVQDGQVATISSLNGGNVGWFETGSFGGSRFTNPEQNTDNGFFTFVTNAGTTGQPWYCPDMFALHYADGVISRLSTTGQNCLTNPSQAAWNEHPTFNPSGTRMSYVSALGNNWNPANLNVPVPLDLWAADITYSGSSLSLSNNTRLTYYNGNYTSQPENTNEGLLMSQMQWDVDGQSIVHIRTCSPSSDANCPATYGDAELRFNGPFVNNSGLVNSASYAQPVAPGSIAAVFGTFGISGSANATNVPLPSSILGLSFPLYGGTSAPVFFVSPLQTIIQVPWELATSGQNAVAAAANGESGPQEALTVVPFAPGIFAINGQGTGQGAIQNLLYQTVDTTHPATPGSTYIVIYCTGLGAVTNQPATGAASPSNPVAKTLTMPVVTVGGAAASVAFSGLAPGAVGTYQVNALVPAGVASGNAVPVQISIGGATSNTVTIAVN